MKLLFNLFAVILCLLDQGVTAAELEQINRKSGEAVTLYTGVLRKPSDVIIWYFYDNVVIVVTPTYSCTDVQCKNGDWRFRNRLELDNQTGSLTIRELTFRDSGVFKLKINSSVEKSFEVDVNPPDLSSSTVTAIYAGMFGGVVVSYIVVSISVMLVAVIITGGVIYCCHGKRENGELHTRLASYQDKALLMTSANASSLNQTEIMTSLEQ